MVLTTGHGGGREGEAVLAKFGEALALGFGLAPLPWLLPSSLDLLHSQLALGDLLDYRELQDKEEQEEEDEDDDDEEGEEEERGGEGEETP